MEPNRFAEENKDLLFMPPRASAVTLDSVERQRVNKSQLIFGLPEIDQRYNPGLPGHIISFLARPGMCKTTLAIYLARLWAPLVRAQAGVTAATNKPPLIVFYTAEVMVEEFMAAFVADKSGQSLADIGRGVANVGLIRGALAQTLGNNLAVIGQSSEVTIKSGFRGVFLPSVYNLDAILTELRSQGYPIAAVFVDYLQRLGDKNNKPYTDNRTAVVGENFMLLKSIAMAHQTCVVVCAQAGRHVDDYGGLKFPLLGDGQHSSVIEQDSNKAFGITMPCKYIEVGKTIACNGLLYEVTESLVAIKKLKERFGQCTERDVYMCEVDLARAIFRPAVAVGEVEDENSSPF